MSKERIKALSKFLEVEEIEVETINYVPEKEDTMFSVDGAEYLVLTDDEADQRAADYIRDTVWSFNASFLLSHMPNGMNEESIKIIQEQCESGNEPLKNMIVDLDHFIDDAISCDGRGHFMSSYDGEENEEGEYFIYRTN